jgi:hypothetical protein
VAVEATEKRGGTRKKHAPQGRALGLHEETDMDQLIVFWNENSSSIVVSFVVGFIFFVLGPIGVWFSGRKIRRERVQKAKDLLIDLVEGMIVSHEEITLEKLKKMYRAINNKKDSHFKKKSSNFSVELPR